MRQCAKEAANSMANILLLPFHSVHKKCTMLYIKICPDSINSILGTWQYCSTIVNIGGYFRTTIRPYIGNNVVLNRFNKVSNKIKLAKIIEPYYLQTKIFEFISLFTLNKRN